MNRAMSKLYVILFLAVGFIYVSCDDFPFAGFGDGDPDVTDSIYEDPTDSIWIDEGDSTDIVDWPEDSTDIDWPDDDTIDWPIDTVFWPGDSIYEDSIP